MPDVTVEHFEATVAVPDVSDFLCGEMLLEHLEGVLDTSRRIAVERLLESSQESQIEYRKLLQGLEYCEVIRTSGIAEKSIQEIQLNRGIFSKLIDQLHWRQWPEFGKSFVQAACIAVVTASVVTLLPWNKLPIFSGAATTDRTIELARLNSDSEIELPAVVTEPIVVAGNNIEKPSIAKTKPSVVLAVVPQINKEPKEKILTVSPQVIKPAASVAEKTKKPAVVSSVILTRNRIVNKGILHRIYLDLDEVDKYTESIAEKIRELGGEKAGQKNLGWRTKGGRYFHFKISEKQYGVLIIFLKGFGLVREKKHAHRIVMPAGVRRSVLWIEDIKKKK